MAGHKPAETFPPGEFLKDELEERGWTQSDFAEIIGRTVGTVNEIITAKRRITPEIAHSLSVALETSDELWLNLETAYQLSKVNRNDDNLISRRARIHEKAPVNEMIRRGWLKATKDVYELEQELCRFFDIETLQEESALLHAARKSTSYGEDPSAAQKAWLTRARQMARTMEVGRFSAQGVEHLVRDLKLLLEDPEEIRHVPRILSNYGVKFVVIQPLTKTRIDGACFWDTDSPVIAMSLRFDRIDNFWFVLMHELAHVKQGRNSLDLDMEKPSTESEKPELERLADEFAGDALISKDQLDSFVSRVGPLYTIQKISGFARRQGVHPGIVVGQLQHRQEIAYSKFRNTLVKVRDSITSTTLTDGWGSSVPVL